MAMLLAACPVDKLVAKGRTVQEYVSLDQAAALTALVVWSAVQVECKNVVRIISAPQARHVVITYRANRTNVQGMAIHAAQHLAPLCVDLATFAARTVFWESQSDVPRKRTSAAVARCVVSDRLVALRQTSASPQEKLVAAIKYVLKDRRVVTTYAFSLLLKIVAMAEHAQRASVAVTALVPICQDNCVADCQSV